MTHRTQATVERGQLLLESFFGRRDIHGMANAFGTMSTGHKPIRRVHLAAHLRGELWIGAHCTAADNTVRWSCIDVDGDHLPPGVTDREAVRRVLDMLVAAGLSCLVERSKSRGYHIWIFFAEPLPAWKVRAALCALVAEAGLPDLEVNPKQHYVEETESGYGNFVFSTLAWWLRPCRPDGVCRSHHRGVGTVP